MKSMKYKVNHQFDSKAEIDRDQHQTIEFQTNDNDFKSKCLKSEIIDKNVIIMEDEAVNVDYDEDDMNEVVIITNGQIESHHSINETGALSHQLNSDARLRTTEEENDSASSSESGFGTVDDEIEAAAGVNQKENNTVNPTQTDHQVKLNQCQPLQQDQRSNMIQQQQSIDSSNSQQSGQGEEICRGFNSSNKEHQYPILQPPRQIKYESNRRDDAINILNDNTSIISSSSSTNSSSLANCCQKLNDSLTGFYYSCFCCYSTTSNTNQTPFIWSWLSIFCCCCPLLGAISLYLTHRSKKFKLKQKYDLAEKYSNYAEKLNIASLIIGVIFYAIAFFFITLVIFMYWRPHNS